jgi:hypothetical protein
MELKLYVLISNTKTAKTSKSTNPQNLGGFELRTISTFG